MACSKGMSKGAEEEERKLRECMLCHTKGHWRRMQAIFIDMTDTEAAARAGTAAEKHDVRSGRQYGNYMYKCIPCVAREENCTVNDAARLVKQPRRQRDLERAKQYVAAKEHVMQIWKFLEVVVSDDEDSCDTAMSSLRLTAPTDDPRPPERPASEGDWTMVDKSNKIGPKKSKRQLKKEKRKMAHMQITKVADIFSPIFHLLALKESDEKAAAEAAGKFQAWLSKRASPDDEEDMEEGDALEVDFEEKLGVQRSFLSCEDPAAMRRAADYSDEWFHGATGGFRVYYFCEAGGAVHQCLTLTLSDQWDRLHEQPDATGQRWYCPICGTRYKTKFGVLCEMLTKETNIAYYAKAEFPPGTLRDVKCMAIEENFRNCVTPEELLKALPRVSPRAIGTVFRPAGPPGAFRITKSTWESLPKLEWFQLYNLKAA